MVAALPLASGAAAGPYLTSPVMTTPRPLTATLLPHAQNGSLVPVHCISPLEKLADADTDSIVPDDSASGRDEDVQSTVSFDISPDDAVGERDGAGDDVGDLDGRMTPLASEHSRQSPPAPHHPADPSTSNPTQPAFNVLPVPQAEIGLSSLATEKQLREAAIGKDRMFLLLLSQEIESFVKRVVSGEQGGIEVQPGHVTSAALATFGPAMALATTTTSKYQRMLMYKAAEWYGLKGICGPDNLIYVGVVGSLPGKSPNLRFADLAPKPPTPKQSFKIMQRVPLGSAGSASSRAGSVAGDESEAGGSKRKTMEEREAEYALARERIYGSQAEAESSEVVLTETDDLRARASRQAEDEDDFVPRRSNGPPQPVYASLYHPKPEPVQPPPPPQPAYQTDAMFAYQQNPSPYGYPYNNGYAPQTPQQHLYPPRQGYMDGSAPPFIPQTGFGGNQWQMPQPHGPVPGPSQGWYNPTMGQNQPMPMIPQGIPAYPQQYPYQQQHHQLPQQQVFAPLVQPTPMRPGPQPHPLSSTSSSISSRSYQDYSRPHSRGSTTSTRSATSSVRLGAMYPAGNAGPAGPGYRQKGMKGQGVNSMTTLGLGEKRSTRGHSPSSVTTSSSRSSRRANSIQVHQPAPNQHQLPQRPDWAANNIPYHPSPIPPAGSIMGNAPNNSDFPPLRQNFHAVPMQVERAKHTPSNGTVWNGRATYPAAQLPHPSQMHPNPNAHIQPHAQASVAAPQLPPPHGPGTSTPAPLDSDPDFPRRVPSGRPAGTLFDPSGSASAAKHSPASAISVPDSTATAVSSAVSSTVADGLSTEDQIEAKLQALSISQGIAIGPPPKSYAKIVRRE